MRWPWSRRGTCPLNDEREARLIAAEQKLAELEVRGGRAARFVLARHEHNCWTETVQQIVRGGAH